MMHGMAGALRAIFFGFALMFFMLTMFSIVTVNLIHPLNKELAKSGAYDDRERCDRAFRSVVNSNLTFLTTIRAGNGCGTLAVPMLEANPYVVFLSWSVPS